MWWWGVWIIKREKQQTNVAGTVILFPQARAKISRCERVSVVGVQDIDKYTARNQGEQFGQKLDTQPKQKQEIISSNL